MGSGSLFNY